jgi:hypothetical protein
VVHFEVEFTSYLVSEVEDRVPSLERTTNSLIRRRYPTGRQIVIKNLPEALKMVKEMNLTSDDEWSGEFQDAARASIGKVLKDRMEDKVAGHLTWAYQRGIPDRRNGSYIRRVLTGVGDIILSIPRTRRFSPRGIVAAYARRVKEIDHLILTCFLLGLSTRKVGIALLSILGEKVSPQTVSRVAKTLDEAVRVGRWGRCFICYVIPRLCDIMT